MTQAIDNRFRTRFITDPRFYGASEIMNVGDWDPTPYAARDWLNALALYNLSYRDSHTAAVLQKRERAVLSNALIIRPGNDGDTEKRATDILEQWANGFDFDGMTAWMLQAVNYGVACVELVWQRNDDGIFLPRRWLGIDPYRIRVRKNGDIAVLTNSAPMKGIILPKHRLLAHRYRAGGGTYPYGRGLGSVLYWLISKKRLVEQFWAQSAERTGSPLLVLTQSENGELKDLKDAAENYKSLGSLILPFGTEKDVIGGDKESRGEIFQTFVREVDETISRLVLGETLTSRIAGQASRAAATVHNDVRQETAQEDSESLNAELNSSLMQSIFEFNWNGFAPSRFTRDFRTDTERRQIVENVTMLRNIHKRYSNENAVLTSALGGEIEDIPATERDYLPQPQGQGQGQGGAGGGGNRGGAGGGN